MAMDIALCMDHIGHACAGSSNGEFVTSRDMFSAHQVLHQGLRFILSFHHKFYVVTGGEPLTWDMNPLVDALHEVGMKVHVETSGAYPLTGDWDWICLSPKKTAPPKQEYYTSADELKVIVYNQNDFKWAEEHAEKVGEKCALFLQPEWSKREEMMPHIVDYVMKHPRWKVSLQTHKYLNIP